MEINNIKSKLQQKNLYFKKIVFERGKEIPAKFRNNFDVHYDYQGENSIIVELETKIESTNNMFLEIILIGEFQLLDASDEISKEEKKVILEKNTVAIMFPYLRSQVTLITAQPNMPALNIPAININALIEQIKEHK